MNIKKSGLLSHDSRPATHREEVALRQPLGIFSLDASWLGLTQAWFEHGPMYVP